ncbi:MAG: nitrate reductase [Pseudomonadales bacterium]|nr:nitrate reductase [Pseudomonadales bacterium]
MKNQALQAVPNLIVSDAQQGIKTTCPYCGVGCGVQVRARGEKLLVSGDPEHPANFGKLCIKGQNLAQTIDNSNRLIQPQIMGESVSWEHATAHVAEQLQQTIKQYGPDSVAFYVSGQLLTEDYYLANKLMKGFIGSGNIDTNSRLCMSSAVAAQKRAFGEDVVPMSYSDITKADLIVLTGSNLAWCHPILYQRIREEKSNRPDLQVVVIDPRITASNELADLHLPIAAGGDLILYNGLLDYLARNNQLNCAAQGLTQALLTASIDAQKLTEIGLKSADIERFFELFANSGKVVTLYSQGINQSIQGVDQGNAIINCHLASGKIGREGCGPFSITGQPNAMGGREVGALANTLASHIEFDDSHMHSALAEFWRSDKLATKPGLKALDLFQAIEHGSVKAIWIMATNPAVSMPDNEQVRAALSKCPLVIVSDCVANNDTLQFADVILPAQAWGEKSGTVTNSERRISRQRAFLEPFAAARADWWIIAQVAKHMGFAEQFSYQSARDVFVEHAALSGLANKGSRAFDISAFSDTSEAQYKAWKPIQWPQAKGELIKINDQLLFADQRYYTKSKRAQLIAVSDRQLATSNASFILNTGRVRDQWHTQTRTGKSALLSNHYPEPLLEINPTDAAKCHYPDQSLVQITSGQGSMLVRLKYSFSQTRKNLFMAIHWSNSNSRQGTVGQLVTANVDPISGQPAFKHAKVDLQPALVNSEAQLLVRDKLPLDICFYQVQQSVAGGFCYHLASEEPPKVLFERLNSLLQKIGMSSHLKAIDDKSQYYRQSYFTDQQPQAAVFVARQKQNLPGGWVNQFFNPAAGSRGRLQPIAADVETMQNQQLFCQCLKVPVKDIKAALEAGHSSVDSIRKLTGAGNSCGSCIGDLSLMLSHAARTEATQLQSDPVRLYVPID